MAQELNFYTRLYDNLSLEIRNKRLTRDMALKIVKKDKHAMPINQIKILAFKDKDAWELVTKYNIGGRRNES